MEVERAHVFPVRVYYEDTDFSGVVYHASYLRFMERGRTEMLRAQGVEQGGAVAGEGGARFGFAVRAMTIDFLRPARMDDALLVRTIVREIGGASMDLDQAVLRCDEILATARVRIACVADGRARRIPAAIRDHLQHG